MPGKAKAWSSCAGCYGCAKEAAIHPLCVSRVFPWFAQAWILSPSLLPPLSCFYFPASLHVLTTLGRLLNYCSAGPTCPPASTRENPPVACFLHAPGGVRPRAVQPEREPAAPIAPLFLGAGRGGPPAAGGRGNDLGGADGGDRSWPLHGLNPAGSAAAVGEGGGRSAAGASQRRAKPARYRWGRAAGNRGADHL